ncbi:MAG: alpha/beta hydrolase [Sulfitobacter sp.]
MSKLKFSGPLSLRFKSFGVLNRIALATYFRHLMGRRLAPDWDAHIEIGIRFWRHQFTAAMRGQDIERGRVLFDSVQTETDDHYDVRVSPSTGIKGKWYHPNNPRCDGTMLYLHGGGYTFRAAISARFAAMLAHHTGAAVFAPEYRLTPEHPHPAQAEDALTAWSYLREKVPTKDIVVVGDSAGGHMALMLLQSLKSRGLAQPALCIGLCPWTDIGGRGASLHENDRFDLVQGWMALQFGKWLDPKGRFGREALSPIYQDYSGTAPIYLQAGGREILHDMIVEFAQTQQAKGCDVTIDVWPDMPHDFQVYDSLKASSSEAIQRIVDRITKLDRG